VLQLAESDLFAIAALAQNNIVGDFAAYMLPMTRSGSWDIFIYDLAVLIEYHRMGVGRILVMALRENATAAGVQDARDVADNDGFHAIEF
jgi:aminoglycoside 3-N-acetyltransferase I